MNRRGVTVRVGHRVGDIHTPIAQPILIGLSVVAFGTLLFTTSYMNFYGDEWRFVTNDRAWNLSLFLLPQNQYWSAIPILVWKLLFLVVGIHSHIPFEATLLASHIASVFLLFTLVRRRSGDLPAFAAAVLVLFLGSGGTDIVWAYQIGFVGSVAFGLLAMLLLDGAAHFVGRMAGVSAALLCSLMCSGVGLAFLVAVAVELAFDPRRRRFLPSLIAPVAGFVAWFSVYGPSLPTTGGIVSLSGFVAWGVEASAAAAFGLPNFGAIIVPIVALVVALQWYRQARIDSWLLGMGVGLLVWFILAALGRAPAGPSGAGDPRFVYVGAVFLLPLVADSVRMLPWYGPWRTVLAGALAIGLLGNVLQLSDSVRSRADVMRTENAELQTIQVFRGAPDMALDRSADDTIVPQMDAAQYLAAVQELGSPVPSISVDKLRQLPPHAVDQVMVNLFGDALTVATNRYASTQGLECRDLNLKDGSAIDLHVGDGQSVMLKSSTGGVAFLFLGLLSHPTSHPLMNFEMAPTMPEWLHLPDTGLPVVWQLQIRTGSLGSLEVCGPPGLQQDQSAGNLYATEAASGTLDSGWSTVPDSATSDGRAAKASGAFASSQNDVFGGAIVPVLGVYDVWYRVRVAKVSPAAAEMTLGVLDDSSGTWAGSTRYSPDQVKTTYTWVRVASKVIPPTGHSFHFVASFIRQLSTDWYVDQAVMLPSGSSGPA